MGIGASCPCPNVFPKTSFKIYEFELSNSTWTEMPRIYFFSAHAYCKMLNLFFAFITTLGTFYAIEDSPWERDQLAYKCQTHRLLKLETFKFQVVLDASTTKNFSLDTAHCPSRAMERFALVCSAFVFVLGCLNFLACLIAHIETVNQARNIDLCMHVASGIAIWVAYVSMFSTELATEENSCKSQDANYHPRSQECHDYLDPLVKYIFMGLSCISGLLYAITGVVIEHKKLFGMSPPKFGAPIPDDASPSSRERDAYARRESMAASRYSRMSTAGGATIKLVRRSKNGRPSQGGSLGGTSANEPTVATATSPGDAAAGTPIASALHQPTPGVHSPVKTTRIVIPGQDDKPTY